VAPGRILGRMDLLRRVPDALAWARAHPVVADGLLGALLAAVSLIALVVQASNDRLPPPGLLAVALVLAGSLPLAWRRRQPLWANMAVGAAAVAYGAAPFPDLVTPVLLGGVVALYSAVAWCGRRTAVVIGVVTGVSVVVIALVPKTHSDLADFSSTTLLLAGAWLLGDSARVRRAYTTELEARAAWLARERDLEAQRAVTAERARIARELHDVIAHHVSMMVVQAEAGPVAAERDGPGATRGFDAIAGIGRQALAELRRLLGVLRQEGSESEPGLAPQPGVAQLPALAEQVSGAGLAVELVVEGERVSLPAGMELSAYRIVQEALTNAVKHAGASRARVLVGYGERELRIEVRDDGRGVDGQDGHGGHGLIGMRERVHLFGGELSAGPGPQGGFVVAARLPLGGGG
jgi:signal transduction histidine kinase